jgi:ferrous iron transport protein A
VSSIISLSDLNVGERARVISFKNNFEASRLMTMGILPGEVIKVVQKTILGTSLFIQSENLRFALRKKEAASIIVSKE